MVWANSGFADSYEELFHHTKLSVELGSLSWKKDLVHWINDLLMSVFFFLIGLEIKREVLFGQLSHIRRAALPLIAAAGGMAVPGLIYTLINVGGDGMHGWGVPTATDIAFALGIMGLLGSRVPIGLKVFLTTLAIADDLGALLVIAIFYSDELQYAQLAFAGIALVVMFILNRFGVRSALPYIVCGGFCWWFIYHSGVHATISGVLAAITIPSSRRADMDVFADFVISSAERLKQVDPERASDAAAPLLQGHEQDITAAINDATNKAQNPLQKFENMLLPWVNFAIVPIFALANAGVPLWSRGDVQNAGPGIIQLLTSKECLGIFFGLVLGKPIGVMAASFLAVKTGLGELPAGVAWRHVHGAAWLAGIGFTMSLFIGNLAFSRGGAVNTEQVTEAKLGILGGSLVASCIGLAVLARATRIK
jgi:NhaA family Na+:H+ antiporter